MKTFTRKDIIANSSGYHAEHGVKQSDADLATELANIIRSTRSASSPKAGDIMICIGAKAEYPSGHIDKRDLADFSAICTKPSIPFVFKAHSKRPQVVFDTSGGYWFSIPKPCQARIRYIGQRDKLFKTWGHCGACKNGAFNFSVKVNVWSYESDVIY